MGIGAGVTLGLAAAGTYDGWMTVANFEACRCVALGLIGNPLSEVLGSPVFAKESLRGYLQW